MFLRAICNPTLPRPRNEILIHNMAREPPSSCWIFDWAMPGWNRSLLVGLAPLRNPLKSPRHAQRVFIVHWNTPFEMTAGEQRIGPQTHASDGPERIGFPHTFANTSINEAVLKLLEIQLQMLWRIRSR